MSRGQSGRDADDHAPGILSGEQLGDMRSPTLPLPMLTPQMHLRRRDMVRDGLPGLDPVWRDGLCRIEGVANGGAGMIRHARPNRCPRCHAATFSVRVGFTKPQFDCDNGCSFWSSGLSGAPYLEHARNYNGGGAESWVEFVWKGGELVETGVQLQTGVRG